MEYQDKMVIYSTKGEREKMREKERERGGDLYLHCEMNSMCCSKNKTKRKQKRGVMSFLLLLLFIMMINTFTG